MGRHRCPTCARCGSAPARRRAKRWTSHDAILQALKTAYAAESEGRMQRAQESDREPPDRRSTGCWCPPNSSRPEASGFHSGRTSRRLHDGTRASVFDRGGLARARRRRVADLRPGRGDGGLTDRSRLGPAVAGSPAGGSRPAAAAAVHRRHATPAAPGPWPVARRLVDLQSRLHVLLCAAGRVRRVESPDDVGRREAGNRHSARRRPAGWQRQPRVSRW